jgi:hypothetical protein
MKTIAPLGHQCWIGQHMAVWQAAWLKSISLCLILLSERSKGIFSACVVSSPIALNAILRAEDLPTGASACLGNPGQFSDRESADFVLINEVPLAEEVRTATGAAVWQKCERFHYFVTAFRDKIISLCICRIRARQTAGQQIPAFVRTNALA